LQRRAGQRDSQDIAQRGARGHATDGPAVHGDLPVRDPRLNARPRGRADVGQVTTEHEIETPPGVAAVGRQDARRWDHRHPIVARPPS
jgi:hypothetical protein